VEPEEHLLELCKKEKIVLEPYDPKNFLDKLDYVTRE